MNNIFPKIFETVAPQVGIAALATVIIHFAYKNVPTKISNILNSAIPTSTFGMALMSFALVVVVRIWDRILGNKLDPNATKPQNIFTLKQFAGGGLTVLTGAVAGAITSVVTGTALVPAIISVAVTAAIVWAVVKIVDAIVFKYQKYQVDKEEMEQYVYLDGSNDIDF